MLVLSRRPGEEVIIGGDITIKIVSVQGNRVRLAIDAPPEVSIDRAEVHQRRQEFAEPESCETNTEDASLTCSGL